MQGRPPTAKPRPRPPVRGQPAAARASPQGRPASLTGAAARKGGRRRSRGQQPVGVAAAHGHTCLQRDARKGIFTYELFRMKTTHDKFDEPLSKEQERYSTSDTK
ncbi:hypothetical protein GW17_00035894 [Ensete ventricosum]|nr:hypothetical protein GW17_00035894 [Ensete ventricosum]